MSGAIVLVGGGGHAKVVADSVRAFGVSIAGFVDDDPNATMPSLDHLGGLDAVREPWIMCVGDVPTRLLLLDRLDGVAASVMHPSAVVGERVELGAGMFIGPNAVVNADAIIGDHAIVNSGAIVEHDASVGRASHVAPGAVLCGAADVGEGCLVGAGAVVLPGVRIGDHAVIGAGSVVTADVPPHRRAVGSPARLLD
ncbi:MAG: NeuD/PglB/VioB family sugar acetyltransferase [Phycisphaerales bacterium]|nr:NeuD/PglB/VioB family sugar acetyltransferase [Phycisphaerales bacterium]